MNKFKNFIGKNILVFAIALMVGILGNSNVHAATVGKALTTPEAGWQRIDDSDKNIEYINATILNANFYYKNATRTISNGKVKFNFTGDKIRIIGDLYNDLSTNVTIKIDNNIVENYNCNGYGANHYTLLYEKNQLENKEHYVEISSADRRFEIDAIDIDSSGTIKPYNENSNVILNIEPSKNNIHINETVSANLTIDNIKDIAAEDVRVKYDNTKLKFLGMDEVDGIKLVKSESKDGELRFILASKGAANVVNAKKALLKLKFQGIAKGEALVDVVKGRVSDGITMENDLTDDQCGQATIIVDDTVIKDVNNSGEFTLLDLAIDGRHFGEDPSTLTQYNTDIVVNNAIDNDDLTKIGEYMLANPNYTF